jgi:site-specific DNA recombinase
MPQTYNTSHSPTDDTESTKELAAVYARVSSTGQLDRDGDEDGDGYSLPAQVEGCKREATDLGAELAKVYMERAESARSDNRPVLQQMMRELPALGVKYLIVHKVDRLARNRLDDAVLYQRLVGMGITLVSASESIDETPPGRLMHGMLATFAEYYSNNLSTEVKKGLRRKHELGGTPFKPPIGYLSAQRQAGAQGVRGVGLDKKRAPLVRLAFQLYVTGDWSLRDLGTYLAEQGLRSRGTPKYPERVLGPNRIHELLKNPYYMGIVKWDGRSYKGRHPTLVDAEAFEQVQVILAAQRIGGERPQLHHHYLRGTVFCDECLGRLLFGRHRGRSGTHYDYFSCANRAVRQRRIRCDASGHYSVPRVEDHVEQLYRSVYLSPEVMQQIRTELRDELANRAGLVERQAEQHERTLKQTEAKQEKLVQLYYDELVTVDVFERQQIKLKAEAKAAQRLRRIAIVQAENAEQALDEAIQRLEDIAKVYHDGTPMERRILNRAIFKRIDIGEEGEITATALTPTYDALSAWNPSLGRPIKARRQTQETTGPCSGFVRPSSVAADEKSQVQNLAPCRECWRKPRKYWDFWSAVLVCSRLFPARETAEGPQRRAKGTASDELRCSRRRFKGWNL